MPKPYALSLYDSVLNTTQRFQRSLTQSARGWKRSIRSMGGYWQGSFTLDGTRTQMQDAFETWLGYHVSEKAAGVTSWEGMVYEMDLTVGGITRRRSLDLMANRIKTTYLTLDYVGSNFGENSGFELGNGASDMYSWTEQVGTAGGVFHSNATAHSGTYSVKLDGDTDAGGPTGGGTTWVRQNINVTPGAKYRLSFWTRGDAGALGNGNYGWVGIDDPNTTGYNWVLRIEQTYYVSATWKQIVKTFIGPSEGEIMLYLCAPDNNGRTAYFDDIEILEEAQCVYETPWAQVEDTTPFVGPQVRYGVKEEVVHLDNYPLATSMAYRDTYLAESAWPWPRTVSIGKRGEATLEVLCCGYVFTGNWLHVMQGNGAAANVDAWIRLIVGSAYGRDPLHGGTTANGGDCQFLRTGNIAVNNVLSTPDAALQAPQLAGIDERPWDVLQELTALGDSDGNPWRAWVGNNRLFHYQPVTVTPRYYIRADGIFDTMAGRTPSNPWLMQPAVFRDMGYRPSRQEPGSFLPTARDIYVDEVVMADGYDRPDLKTTTFSEAAIIQLQADRG